MDWVTCFNCSIPIKDKHIFICLSSFGYLFFQYQKDYLNMKQWIQQLWGICFFNIILFHWPNAPNPHGKGVGTPPLGKHVARSSWWRVARAISRTIIIRTIIIRILLKICMVRLSYPEPLKERQTTFQLLLPKEEQTTLAERRHPDSLHNTSG